MYFSKFSRLGALLIGGILLGCTPAQSATLVRFDFNDGKSWPSAYADVMPSTPIDLATTFEVKPSIGATDASKPSAATPGLLIGAEVGKVELNWTATYASGLLPVQNAVTDSGALRLGLQVSASAARPIKVQIESFNAKKRRTGGLETSLTPKTANVFEPFDLALSDFKPVGAGKFLPDAAFVQFSFILEAPAWPNEAIHQIRIDDLTLSDAPAPMG